MGNTNNQCRLNGMNGDNGFVAFYLFSFPNHSITPDKSILQWYIIYLSLIYIYFVPAATNVVIQHVLLFCGMMAYTKSINRDNVIFTLYACETGSL